MPRAESLQAEHDGSGAGEPPQRQLHLHGSKTRSESSVDAQVGGIEEDPELLDSHAAPVRHSVLQAAHGRPDRAADEGL